MGTARHRQDHAQAAGRRCGHDDGRDRGGRESRRRPRHGLRGRQRDRAGARIVRGLLADPEVDAVYISLPNGAPPRLDDARPRRRQARAVREALHAPSGGSRRGVRRCRGGRARPLGGVHVAPPSAGRTAAFDGRGDRPAPADPGDVQLRARERSQRPRPGRSRRRFADGCRVLLRQRRAAAGRRGADRGHRRRGVGPERGRSPVHRDPPLPERPDRRVQLGLHLEPPRPRGHRSRRVGARDRSVELVPGDDLARRRRDRRRAGRPVHPRARGHGGGDPRRAARPARSGGRSRSGPGDRSALSLSGDREPRSGSRPRRELVADP